MNNVTEIVAACKMREGYCKVCTKKKECEELEYKADAISGSGPGLWSDSEIAIMELIDKEELP